MLKRQARLKYDIWRPGGRRRYAHDARRRKRRGYAAFAQSLLVVLLRPELGSPLGCENESSTLRNASTRSLCAGTST